MRTIKGSANVHSFNTSQQDSVATSADKKTLVEANQGLIEEIREINHRFIDTVVEIYDEGSEGTVLNFRYTAVALSPALRSHYGSSLSPIQPLQLLVPSDYPNCSPVLLENFPVEVSMESEDLSTKVRSKFWTSLENLSQPMSFGDMARAWNVCVRAAMLEYAKKSGGGSFSSRYGPWENCLSVA